MRNCQRHQTSSSSSDGGGSSSSSRSSSSSSCCCSNSGCSKKTIRGVVVLVLSCWFASSCWFCRWPSVQLCSSCFWSLTHPGWRSTQLLQPDSWLLASSNLPLLHDLTQKITSRWRAAHSPRLVAATSPRQMGSRRMMGTHTVATKLSSNSWRFELLDRSWQL